MDRETLQAKLLELENEALMRGRSWEPDYGHLQSFYNGKAAAFNEIRVLLEN